MAIEKSVQVPDIGDFHDVEVIEILVKVGDSIHKEDSLVTLESDKATIEIPSPYAGVVQDVMVKLGDKVSQGTILLQMQLSEKEKEAHERQVAEPETDGTPPLVKESTALAASEEATASRDVLVEREVVVPDIGDFSGVEVIEILISVGESVDVEQSLVTLESDKASIEIPSPLAGQVTSIAVRIGDRVSMGDQLLKLQTVAQSQSDETVQAYPDTAPAVAADVIQSNQAAAPMTSLSGTERMAGEKEFRQPPVLVRPADFTGRLPHASPSVRHFARELGADLTQIIGTGPKQRITKKDIQNYIKQMVRGAVPATVPSGALQLPALPEIDFAKFGEVEEVPLNRIRKLSGAHLSACWLNIPHVTQHDQADITDLEAFRQEQKGLAVKREIRMTLLPFLMKACVAVLREMPEFNSSLTPDRGALIFKKYFHIGVAVDTPNGLVVPVVRDVDKKGVLDLAAELMAVSARARDGKLSPSDLKGGCFSISSLGGIGGSAFTPIVNAPEVAILGVSKSTLQPVWNGREFQPRLMLPLSLSYDHRVIDGAMAARFTSLLAEILTDIRRLLL